MRSIRSALWVSVLVWAGCGGPVGSGGGASSTLARLDGDVFAVNVDEGTVSRVSAKGETRTSPFLGREPTRIAAAAGRVFVTLRAEGELVALDAETLEVTMRVAVGAEPYGVVTTADGSRAYVAVSLEDKVLELDTASGATLRSFAIPHEPKWLALHPSETALFVAAQRSGGVISSVDLESGRVRTQEPPPAGGDQLDPDHGTVPLASVPDHLTPRTTGDLVVTPDGSGLAVPTLYVDVETPVSTLDTPQGGGYAGSGGAALSRLNPALVVFDVDRSGGLSNGRPVFLGNAPGGEDGQDRARVFRSYPNAAAVAPDGRYFAVAMEGSDAVVVVDREPFAGQAQGEPRRKGGAIQDNTPSLFGFWDRPLSLVQTTGSGPRGLAFVGDELFVHTFLDRRVESVRWSDATAANRLEADDARGDAQPPKVTSRTRVQELVAGALSPEVDRGRRLFLSAVTPEMSVPSGGVSCGTCHVDGREDSLSWPFLEGGEVVRLQTPSLAADVGHTAPLTWRSPVETVADEALLTTTLRMGGRGPDVDDLLAIEAFVVSGRSPRATGLDAAVVAEGRALFERADVGCATCHSGAQLTDGRHHRIVGGLEANTPGLRGIAASAPYLHDGSMKDLRSVLQWARSGEMGDTSMLSEGELDALETYLRSL